MLAEIYVDVDDFCKEKAEFIKQVFAFFGLSNSSYPTKMTISEVMTIMIYYHLMPYKNFKKYYTNHVLPDLKADFPDSVSYNRFCELMPRAFFVLVLYLAYRCSLSRPTGIYYIDSSKWEVCHPKRFWQHKVMRGFAAWGKSSMGWFYGLKYHLVINQFGELMSFCLTNGSVADNDAATLFRLTRNLYGWIFGDRGYLLNDTKRAFLERHGELLFFSKCRKNMKKRFIPFEAQSWLGKRNLIESVIGLTKGTCDIAHSRHRNPFNAFGNLFAGLCAYTFFERKPCAKINLERRMIPIAA